MTRTRYSPTALRQFEQFCPRALDFYQDRQSVIPVERFAVGGAAHYFLEKVPAGADDATLDAVAREIRKFLIEKGRPGDAIPLAPQHATEGVELGRAWIGFHPIPDGAMRETGIAFDENWKVVPEWNGPSVRFRLVTDIVWHETEVDEETGETSIIVHRDYKSGWGAKAAEVNSLQMRSQSVAVAEAVRQGVIKSHAEVVRRQIANLRTGAIYSEDVWWQTSGLIEQWKHEIEEVMDAADAQAAAGDRPARIGAACFRCDHAYRCDLFQSYAKAKGIPASLEDRARALIVEESRRAPLREALMEHCKETGTPVVVDDTLVGYRRTERRVCAPDAMIRLWRAWEATGGTINGFLRALGHASVEQAEKIVKTVYPRNPRRQAEELEAVITTVPSSAFVFERAGTISQEVAEDEQ